MIGVEDGQKDDDGSYGAMEGLVDGDGDRKDDDGKMKKKMMERRGWWWGVGERERDFKRYDGGVWLSKKEGIYIEVVEVDGCREIKREKEKKKLWGWWWPKMMMIEVDEDDGQWLREQNE